VVFGVGSLKAGSRALRPELVRFGRHLRRGAPAYAVLLISLLLTILAWYYVRHSVDAQNRARFEEATQAAQTTIYRRMNRYLDAMFGARGLLLVSNPVDREEWDGYVRALKPEAHLRLDSFQALGFAKYVRPEEREASFRESGEEGVRNLRPRPDGERSANFPLELVAPSNEANRRMIGYDAYSDPAHRSAMDRARDTDTVEVTGMDYVLTDAPSHSEADVARKKGFVVYLPVYQEGEPVGTVAERRGALRGFVVGIFRADVIFGQTFRNTTIFNPAIDFEVYDGEDVRSSSLVYDSNGVKDAGEKGAAALFSNESHMYMGRRKWSLYFATLPGFEEEAKSYLPAFVLVSGVAVSFLLFGITWMLVRSRTQAMRASADLEKANRELEEANTELQRSRESLVSAREEERRRLRRDLHDGVGPQLAALMLELETASDLVSDNLEASALMAKLSERAGEIVSDVRHSVHALRPPALDELGLVGALREGAMQYGPSGLRVLVEDPEELSHLPAAVEVACYRVAQEALANVVRHARASNCSIRIRVDEEAGALSVEVEDDGRGIREDDRAGVGMISMRERTEELGGRCTVKPLAGGGTLVRALLPFRTTGETSVERSR
jgi:signal transduction histidine kinase/sensor domain CHASE-containing protein